MAMLWGEGGGRGEGGVFSAFGGAIGLEKAGEGRWRTERSLRRGDVVLTERRVNG